MSYDPVAVAEVLTRLIDPARSVKDEIDQINWNNPPPCGSLSARISWAVENLQPISTDLRAVFQPNPLKPAAVLQPSKRWLAAAMHGNILPPVEAYQFVYYETDERLLDYLRPIGPMTEVQAMEYLVIKDLMTRWPESFASKGNRIILRIMRHADLPDNYRGAWALTQPEA